MEILYKLLIVDDEAIIRAGIKRCNKWEDYGFTVCAEAKNGQDGLEMAKLYRPDIVISDIRMPFMDGLEMVKKINAIMPEIKIILLTDYNEFEYARQAIYLKVSSYLLKYSENEEILQAVIKAAKEFEADMTNKEKGEKGILFMRNTFLNQLIKGIGSETFFEDQVRSLGIHFKDGRFCIVILKVENEVISTPNNQTTDNHRLTALSLSSICEEYLSEYGAMVFIGLNQGINILFNAIQEHEIGLVVQKLKSFIEDKLKVVVSIGTGNIYNGYKNIPLSYNDAVIALTVKEIEINTDVFCTSNFDNYRFSNNPIIKQIINYLDKNYNKQNLTLNDIAQAVHVSPTYISTIFKKKLNINFYDYLITMRITKAKELFSHTDLKAYEVCERVGYTDPHHFSILFKRHTGCSISEFKKRL